MTGDQWVEKAKKVMDSNYKTAKGYLRNTKTDYNFLSYKTKLKNDGVWGKLSTTQKYQIEAYAEILRNKARKETRVNPSSDTNEYGANAPKVKE